MAGETLQLSSSTLPGGGLHTLFANSASSAAWLTQGTGINDGISIAAVQYSQLGILSGSLTVIVPPTQVGSFPTTNNCIIVFTGPGAGFYEDTALSIGGSTFYGNFVFNTNLVGQSFAPSQLTAGETYQITPTNSLVPPFESLVVSSSSSGEWVVGGSTPPTGIFSAIAQYNLLGPQVASLNVILPVSSAYPSGTTNSLMLLFNSADQGLYQLYNSSSTSPQLGGFNRTLP